VIAALRYLVAFLAVPLTGTATAVGFALGGPGWAGVACCVTLLACALCAVPWRRA
jgi:hypothetical protein